MQALDQGRLESRSAVSPANEAPVIKAWPKIPEFHHAAAHKMLHYWSKLRINLTVPDLEPLKFLRQVDDADKGLFAQDLESNVPAEIPLSIVIRGIELIFENISQLPFVLRHLFTYAGLSHEVCLDIFKRYLHTSSRDSTIIFNTQSIEELLLQTISLKHLAILRKDPVLSQKADLCFRLALRQVLDMQTQQAPQALPFKFLFVIILLYVYGRPFHSLGLLQSFESLIHNASSHPQGDSYVRQENLPGTHAHFLQRSQIQVRSLFASVFYSGE